MFWIGVFFFRRNQSKFYLSKEIEKRRLSFVPKFCSSILCPSSEEKQKNPALEKVHFELFDDYQLMKQINKTNFFSHWFDFLWLKAKRGERSFPREKSKTNIDSLLLVSLELTENIGFVDDFFLNHLFDYVFKSHDANSSSFWIFVTGIVVLNDDTEMILF